MLGFHLNDDHEKSHKLQPFTLENPIDVSRDQEYYYYYYVGNGKGTPEFLDEIFQWDYGFQWNLFVSDGQGAEANLSFFP